MKHYRRSLATDVTRILDLWASLRCTYGRFPDFDVQFDEDRRKARIRLERMKRTLANVRVNSRTAKLTCQCDAEIQRLCDLKDFNTELSAYEILENTEIDNIVKILRSLRSKLTQAIEYEEIGISPEVYEEEETEVYQEEETLQEEVTSDEPNAPVTRRSKRSTYSSCCCA